MSPSASLRVVEDAWLSGLFGHGAFCLAAEPAWKDLSGDGLRPFKEHEAARKEAFYYAKVPTESAGAVRLLCGAGFFVVDVNVTFSWNPKDPPLPAPEFEMVKIGGEGPLARAAVSIAGSSFKYSRFHLDPLVKPELANRIKAEWIENYVRGKRGIGLFAALLEGKAAGFVAALAAEEGGRKLAVLDLIGVAGSAQGRGLGKALTRFFVNEFRGGFDELRVGTQAANIPSLRLYETCGFKVCRTAYVLHRHLRNA